MPETPVEGTRAGDGVLTIGSILPQTGSLAFLGPPEFAGFDLAIQEINEAGGVLGQDVVGIPGDSGDTNPPNVADQTVDRLLGENVDVIIGAASSAVTRLVIDKITGAGVAQFSPANTSTDLSTYADKGLYFRTAPPDVYQGDVLGQFVVDDGNQTVAIMNLNDAYGNSLAAEVKAVVEESGGRGRRRSRSTTRRRRRSTARSTRSSPPTRTPSCVIGFDESSRILRTMVEKGVGPRRQGRLRLRRQHRQRPRRQLRRRQLTPPPDRTDRRARAPARASCVVSDRAFRPARACRGRARSPWGR